jgi:hydrogenase maturation protease
MAAEVVVFAVGNRSRGDDALGPLLLERLTAWLDVQGRLDEFELIDDFQLQIEHALDLAGRRLALFIDAGVATPAPCAFYPIAAGTSIGMHATHALSPEAVLAVYRTFADGGSPPSFVLCVRGERFGLGDDLTTAAQANLETAWQLLVRLCGKPDAAAWSAATKERPLPVARALGNPLPHAQRPSVAEDSTARPAKRDGTGRA